jgi:hypothetical protein
MKKKYIHQLGMKFYQYLLTTAAKKIHFIYFYPP